MHKQAFVEISCAREKKWGKYSLWWSQEMRMRERGLQTCVRNNLNLDAFNLWPMPIFIFRESGGWTSISLFRLCSKENWAIIQYSYIQHVPGMMMYLPWSHFVFNFWACNEIFSSTTPGRENLKAGYNKRAKSGRISSCSFLSLKFSALLSFFVCQNSAGHHSLCERERLQKTAVCAFFIPHATQHPHIILPSTPGRRSTLLFCLCTNECVFVCTCARLKTQRLNTSARRRCSNERLVYLTGELQLKTKHPRMRLQPSQRRYIIHEHTLAHRANVFLCWFVCM